MSNAPPAPIRAFIACDLGDAIVGELSRCQERLKTVGAHIRWIPPESIHLTLAFLGDTLPEQIERLAGALKPTTEPFKLTCARTGTFGPKRSPRIIWAGIKNSPALSALHDEINTVLAATGFEIEARPYKPHLTLGRVKSTRNVEQLLELLNEENDTGFGIVQINEIILYQSTLTPQGAQYAPLHRFSLRG